MQSYLNLLKDILQTGEAHDDRTGTGTTSLFIYQWRHSMHNGFPLMTTKKVPLRWVFEELRWFLSGSTDERELRKAGVDIWKEWATAEQCAKFGREEGDLGPVYGKLWRDFDGVDQIKEMCDALAAKSNSRRIIVSGWHPQKQKEVALPPCHTLWQMKVHHPDTAAPSMPALSLHLYARSIDAFLGLPFNIASYALLLQLLAHVHNMRPRHLGISFGDLHVYKNHYAQCAEQMNREPRRLPDVRINPRLQGLGFEGLLAATWEDIELINYKPHPKIEAEVSI